MAFLHAVGRAARALVKEGRGINRLEGDAFIRQEQVGQRKLVIDLVVSVGVEDHAAARWEREDHGRGSFPIRDRHDSTISEIVCSSERVISQDG